MDKAGLLQLPGRPEEQDWLRERLEVLTAREGIALDAADCLRARHCCARRAV